MNATLTWWGVKAAIVNNAGASSAVIAGDTLTKVVPVFVAIMVWLIRVLIIGTFSVAGDRLFSQDDQRVYTPSRTSARPVAIPAPAPGSNNRAPAFRSASAGPTNARSAKMASSSTYEGNYIEKPEPTYHPISARPSSNSAYGASSSRPTANQSSNQMRS
jgi:hypothetical protein